MVVLVPNAAGEPRCGYAMRPEQLVEGVRSLEDYDCDLMGTFHSHPSRPAVMSPEDVATAEGTGLLLVVSLSECEWALYDPTRRGKAPVPISVRPPGDPFRRYSIRFT
jgi:proteasome lid subunit RPN8/RPN11